MLDLGHNPSYFTLPTLSQSLSSAPEIQSRALFYSSPHDAQFSNSSSTSLSVGSPDLCLTHSAISICDSLSLSLSLSRASDPFPHNRFSLINPSSFLIMTQFYTLDKWEIRPIEDQSRAQNVEQNSFFLAIHPILMIRGLTDRTRRATEVTSKGFLDHHHHHHHHEFHSMLDSWTLSYWVSRTDSFNA
jgi:hypothetical protein